jgi:ATP-dependent DNA helicase RecQ
MKLPKTQPTFAQALHILKTVFGYSQFRLQQQQIIEHILQKKDTLVIMPTGGGKSICYQIPALLFDGVTIIVSPLISLMHDQVEQLHSAGIPAVMLNSSISSREYAQNISALQQGKAKLLYVAPETLVQSKLNTLLQQIPISCITVDEAHCISEWGHDFRPEYRQIPTLRQQFPHAVCIALTATATQQVRTDIQNNLQFTNHREFISSFNRENLFLEVIPKHKPLQQAITFIQKFPDQAGIIYCSSRKQVESLAQKLKAANIPAVPYHAGLSDEVRAHNQELFRRDTVSVIVATIAFGMGINKPNVRFVIHYDLPKNIESYYQQIGRAGRDGLDAHCLLLFSYGDISKISFFMNEMSPSEARIARYQLNSMVQFAESSQCRRIPLLNYFQESYPKSSCGMCDNCLSAKTPQIDLTQAAQKFLSCVKRTGELYGANYIMDVLRGSKSEIIIQRNHQTLSTYGIGKDQSKKEWGYICTLLQNKQCLQTNEHGSLQLTPQAWSILKGEQRFLARFSHLQTSALQASSHSATSTTSATSAISTNSATSLNHGNETVLVALKAKRKELAQKEGVPAFVIFSDKTLVEMATKLPTSAAELLEIHGIGAVKLDRYGEAFLKILRAC